MAELPPQRIPRAVNIEPVSTCNQRCPMCLHAAPTPATAVTRPALLELELLERMLPRLHRDCTTVNLYLFGEPLLHPRLVELVATIRAQGLVVNTSTNGLLLTPALARDLRSAGLKTLVVSFDGTSPASYRQLRGPGYRQVRRTLEAMAASGGRGFPELVLRSVVHRERAEQVGAYLDWVEGLGIVRSALLIGFMPWPGQDPEPWLPLAPRSSKTCPRPFAAPSVLTDGRVTPCCYDFHGELATGDLGSQALESIVFGPRLQELRGLHRQGRLSALPLCARCTQPRFADRTHTLAMDDYRALSHPDRRALWHRLAQIQGLR